MSEPDLSEEDVSSRHKSKDEKVSTVDRWEIILDKDHPDYEGGTGRQFLVKWGIWAIPKVRMSLKEILF